MSELHPFEGVTEAVDILRKGGVVAMPTETVYGLSASLESPAGIQKIYAVKGRPLNHPLIVHVGHKEDVFRYARDVPAYVQPLIEHFWPGPLTLILKKSDQVPLSVTGGQDTVGIRMPAHPMALSLIQSLGCPVVAPSANRFGRISPTTAQHVKDDLGADVDFILEGGRALIGVESTIMDATHADSFKLLRAGMITATDIQEVLAEHALSVSDQPSAYRAPGLLKSHYAPLKPITMTHAIAEELDLAHSYVLYLTKCPANAFAAVQMPNHPTEYAHQLYFQLRLADASKAQRIIVETPPETGLWQAIQDRLQKATAR
ncbi:MAG: threonylcarbamoyl-AMP synthase [Gammaproteobacteria bacterium]|nr:threonylcarbamoyl-AMP synthase [Gammaproteobacteria bacterium]